MEREHYYAPAELEARLTERLEWLNKEISGPETQENIRASEPKVQACMIAIFNLITAGKPFIASCGSLPHPGARFYEIQFVPYQRIKDLPRYLNECEVFVFPSLFEGHTKALIEAISCGLPVITTPVYGVRNLISYEVNGYLCAGTSSEAIRNGLIEALGDESLSRQIGAAARRHVEENFSLSLVLEKELSAYRELSRID